MAQMGGTPRKPFHAFEDVPTDEPIGGSRRLAVQEVPEGVERPAGLVNPAKPEEVEALGLEIGSSSVVIEVGPGKGAFLVEMARRRPGTFFLGFETRLAFCLDTLRRAERAGLKNLRVIWGDARLTIPMVVPPGAASEAYLLFPDPWWKKKQARRRHGPVMAGVLAGALRTGATLVLKSDVNGYLRELKGAFLDSGFFATGSATGPIPLTDRERRIVENQEKVFAAYLIRR